jgi:adenylylsulfate kinase-like enzyme
LKSTRIVPFDIVIRRDVKGLYKKARTVEHFTGISDPYEPPLSPDIRVDSSREMPDDSLERVWALLEKRELIDRKKHVRVC